MFMDTNQKANKLHNGVALIIYDCPRWTYVQETLMRGCRGNFEESLGNDVIYQNMNIHDLLYSFHRYIDLSMRIVAYR